MKQSMEDIEYEKENVIQRIKKGAGEWEIVNERGWYGYWIIENGIQRMGYREQDIEYGILRMGDRKRDIENGIQRIEIVSQRMGYREQEIEMGR